MPKTGGNRMSLSCSCPDFSPENPGDWWYFIPSDFSKLKTDKRKRCCSCNELINIGSDCLDFWRERLPYTEIEERISGEIIQISSLYMCETCGEIYLNLSDLGYCIDIKSNMQKCLEEYHAITGFKKHK